MNQTVLERQTYTIGEVQQLTGLSQSTIRRYLRAGIIASAQLTPGGRVLIPRAAVDGLLRDVARKAAIHGARFGTST